MIQRFQWSQLTKQQVGAFAEYFVKMELTMLGFQVYGAEVDDHGIDFVARHGHGPFLQIQAKSLRDFGYVFLEKVKFHLHEHTYVAFGLLFDGHEPKFYLIPSLVWRSPNQLFVDRNYESLKSSPEWGMNVSRRNLSILEQYSFEKIASGLAVQTTKPTEGT